MHNMSLHLTLKVARFRKLDDIMGGSNDMPASTDINKNFAKASPGGILPKSSLSFGVKLVVVSGKVIRDANSCSTKELTIKEKIVAHYSAHKSHYNNWLIRCLSALIENMGSFNIMLLQRSY